MEASEKPTSQDTAAVRALDDRLVIEHLEVDDERAARVVRERAEAGQPPARTVADSIEIGARVLEREGTAAEIDYVKVEFGKHAADLAQNLMKLIETGNEHLAEEIAKSFGADRQGSVQHQIKEMLDRSSEAQREAMSRQFSAKDGTNPLFDFKDAVVRALKEADARQQRESAEGRKRIEALTREIVELKEREEGDRRVAEAEERGTAKGRTFEEKVHAALEAISGARGDAAHHVGDTSSEEGGKKGDTVVDLGACEGPVLGRLVFEAKTDQNLTRPKAWGELNGAIEKRDAGYAVMVVAGEPCVPSNTKPWLEYEGNKMIVAVDADEPERLVLEAVYAIARSRTLARAERGLRLDAAGVREAASEALEELRKFATMKKHLTGVANSAESAREVAVAMEARLQELLARIDELVAAGDSP